MPHHLHLINSYSVFGSVELSLLRLSCLCSWGMSCIPPAGIMPGPLLTQGVFICIFTHLTSIYCVVTGWGCLGVDFEIKLGHHMFIRDHHLWKRQGEVAGMGRGGHQIVIQVLTNSRHLKEKERGVNVACHSELCQSPTDRACGWLALGCLWPWAKLLSVVEADPEAVDSWRSSAGHNPHSCAANPSLIGILESTSLCVQHSTCDVPRSFLTFLGTVI